MLEYLQLLVLLHSSDQGRVGCLVNFPVQASVFSAVKWTLVIVVLGMGVLLVQCSIVQCSFVQCTV